MAVLRMRYLTGLCLALLIAAVFAAPQNVTTESKVESLSLDELDEQLAVRHPSAFICHASGSDANTDIWRDIIDVPNRPGAQRDQARPPRPCALVPLDTTLRHPLPRLPGRQRPPRDAVHFRPAQLSTGLVPDQH